ncbi:MAG: phosphopantetheinyl transferase-like protein [Polaromonas sp.]|nr:phosphopantetheinyl transferase-like protein [Polaromonas sp.]
MQVWTARPDEIEEAQWPVLNAWLDSAELSRSKRFRLQADSRAYVLAHALRRLAVARALAVDPASVSFSSQASGQPVLTAPQAHAASLYFSHSHSRDLVMCAITQAGPVGIDVACVADAGSADLHMLSAFMALPDAPGRQAALGGDPARQFFFYWTVLEAYWKARGTGLSFAQPLIRCEKNRHGLFDIFLASAHAWQGAQQRALAVPLRSTSSTLATLVLGHPGADALAGALAVRYHAPSRSDWTEQEDFSWHPPARAALQASLRAQEQVCA